MKVIYRILLISFFTSVYCADGIAQSALQRCFPPTASSVVLFHQAGVARFYQTYYFQSYGWPEVKQLRGSRIPYYQRDFYFDNQIQQSVISLALMNQYIKQQPLNISFEQMKRFRSSQVSPLALPVIFRPSGRKIYSLGEMDLVNRSWTLRKMVEANNILEDVQKQFKEPTYSYNNSLRDLYFVVPNLVDIHVDELPDPPKSKERASADRRTSRESVAELFKRESPTLPHKLDKVDLIKRPWTFSGSENIQFSQAYLKNWAKGGQNSVALLSDLRIKAAYEKGKVQWENSVIHKLGVISSQGSLSRVNDDLIDLNSKYGISASKNWYYSFLFNLKTQFFNGYAKSDLNKETPISAFMAPGYFTLAVGMDFKKGKNFTLMISPVTSKLTLVLDTAKVDQTRYNIAEDKRSEFLTGGSLINNFSWKISEEIKFTSAANVFYDYFEKENKVQAEWDMILDMRINVFLSTRITTNFRYFENESRKIQIRENMSIAFRYNF